jgi:hypothetical protein
MAQMRISVITHQTDQTYQTHPTDQTQPTDQTHPTYQTCRAQSCTTTFNSEGLIVRPCES